ncbi:glycosyl hydrolase 5 family protein-like [Curcuma longa]|uniref:glycosyl hydrolase 5 family protein-like n=1 Tax=Curcuma longa TaxID=136217 RepID=UPI003D9E284B
MLSKFFGRPFWGVTSFLFASKFVFEVHWYGFTDGEAWVEGNTNDVCGSIVGRVNQQAGFLLDWNFPLILSEFGLDLRGTNTNDNRYFSCALAYATAQDMDWTLWALTGSYYLRSGVVDHDEMYGALSFDWSGSKSDAQMARIRSIQLPFQGPNRKQLPGHLTILHPLTGLCVSTDDSFQRLELSGGRYADQWSYVRQTLSFNNGSFFSCTTAGGVGMEVRLEECDTASKWTLLSASQHHVSTQLDDGTSLCLEVSGNGRTVVTNPCRCLSFDSSCDPQDQWFKLANTDQLT